jgi:Flp pilus assembly protein TadD/Tol biopolymer transport system component
MRSGKFSHNFERTRIVLLLAGIVVATTIVVLMAARRGAEPVVLAAEGNPGAITIDYPLNESIFPPEITPPTFIWHDAAEPANLWRIDVTFAGGSAGMRFESHGPRLSIGAIDPRTVSPNNELPKLTDQQASAHTWIPDPKAWEEIKKHSVGGPAEVVIFGFRENDISHVLSAGRVSIQTSKDPVGAPIFYRDVPLMPSETEKGVIKPLAANSIQLIQWRLRRIDQPQSRIVLKDMHTCANCHSFSLDGKTMGLDMDGPQNDKGLYALVPIKPQITIRNEDMVSWNPSQDRQFGLNRVGFMSQVSPDGQYVLTTFANPDNVPRNNFYVQNFKDYRFLQVFFPTRGILAWYDRATGERHPLPGANDPRYVQASGVWSPDGKYVVFARAEAQEPYPADGKMAAYANDPNETQIKYDLYRVPFNGGKGGKAEPIVGASANGMSNSFPKVSPDGRWIVFVQARNAQLMRPDSQLYIIPAQGGQARRLRANGAPMNSWHSFSPNGRWLVFSSKRRSPYTQMYLTHIDQDGNDSPAILIDNATAANRAVNIPEFVNIPPDGMLAINTPAVDMYRQVDYAVALGEKGQDEAAIAEWRKLAAANPDVARIYNNLGAALARTGKFEDAIPQYEKALELNPQYHLVHANLARALMEAGHDDEANLQFQMAFVFYPESPDLHNSYGSALAKQGRLDEATRQFAKAIEINPRLAEAHNNLGKALLSSGQPEQHGQVAEAEKEFETAISLNPHYAEAQNNLGTLYGQEGNDAAAERLFREAIKNDPAYTEALVNLGATLASESHFAEAEVVLQNALRIEPGNKEAQDLRAMIMTKTQGNAPGKVAQ